MKLLRQDPHTLSGAYALDALDNAERERFEQHLRRCEPCMRAVRELHETATRLALAVAQVPPPQLREQVLDAAARTSQNPPVIDQRPAPAARHARVRRHAWVPRLAGVTAAGVLAAAVVLGFTQAATRGRLDRVQAQEQAIETVLSAPDARIVHRTSGVGTATVVYSQARHKMIFTTAGLPPLPASKVYELWLLAAGGGASPAGLLPAPIGGRTAPLLASGLVAGDTAGVTVEPAGGTSKPTHAPILEIPLGG